MNTFLQMGGYAAYVWPSYALTLTVIFLNVSWARRSLAKAREAARRRITMRQEEQ